MMNNKIYDAIILYYDKRCPITRAYVRTQTSPSMVAEYYDAVDYNEMYEAEKLEVKKQGKYKTQPLTVEAIRASGNTYLYVGRDAISFLGRIDAQKGVVHFINRMCGERRMSGITNSTIEILKRIGLRTRRLPYETVKER